MMKNEDFLFQWKHPPCRQPGKSSISREEEEKSKKK
jgi:hypothetical protein